MKTVFLDRATFSQGIELPTPAGVNEQITHDHTPQDDAIIIERSQDADIIITNKVHLGRQVIESLPKLKLIQLTATGMNNVDHQACQDNGVKLYNVAGYAVKSVPEHTLMLMLTTMRAGVHYHQSVAHGDWQASGQFCLMDVPLMDLEGKTLGIIGVGTIGKRVSELASAFGMTVLWAEHQGKPPRNADYTAFDDVLATSDIISLHCPLTDDTHHLLNADTLAKMHKTPIVINVARGGVVDSKAMAKAIQSGQISGYGSDVFEAEPINASDPLLAIANHPRVVLTPHNAWGSHNAQIKLWQILSEQVGEFVKTYDN